MFSFLKKLVAGAGENVSGGMLAWQRVGLDMEASR
jgi:rhodanese-related sulfurtransferase